MTVTCAREVILAAGAVLSPVLLQLSGIGPASILDELNLTVQTHLPGVGHNFQDHGMVGAFYNCQCTYERARDYPSAGLTNCSRHEPGVFYGKRHHRRHPQRHLVGLFQQSQW
jgi:choline dehydrogenase-like flavoprotein